MAERIELDVDLAKIKQELADLRVELSRLSTEAVKDFGQMSAAAKKAGSDTEAAFNVGKAQGVADALDQLQKEYDDLARSAKTLKSALANATDPTAIKLYATSVAQLEVGMKRLEQTGRNAGVNLKNANKEAGVGKQVFEGMFGAFTKVTFILAAIDAVKKFVSFAVDVADETKKANLQFTSFLGNSEKASKLVSDLQGFARAKFLDTSEVLQSGRALLAFGESADNIVPVLGRIADLSAATGKNFNELATIYGKARTSGVLYAEDINQLTDAGIPIIQEFAKQMGVSADQVKKLASEGKISFEELQLAFFNLTTEGSKFAGQAATNAETIGGAWKGLLGELEPLIAKVGGAISSATTGTLNTIRQFISDIKTYGGGAFFGVTGAKGEDAGAFFDLPTKPQGKALEEQQRLEEQAAKRRSELARKSSSDAAKFARELAQARIAALKDGEEKEIATENLRFKELLAQLRKYHLDTAEAEEQHQLNLSKIRVKYELDRIVKAREAREAEAQSITDGANEIAAILESDVQARKEVADKNKKYAEDSADFDAAHFERGLLVAREVFFQKKRTDAEVEEYEKQVAKLREIFQLEQQRAELERTIQFGTALSDTEKETLRLRIKNISSEISQLQQGIGENTGKPFSIFSLLGLDPDKDKAKIDAIKQVFGEISKGLRDITEARVEAAEAEVELATERVEAAEDALDREIEIAQLGFASNVDLKKQELEEAKKAREKALDEQKKAQRQQLIVDSISQASNIAVSSTNLIRSWSSLPFGIGLVLAFAQVAQIVAFMAGIRSKAKAISSQQFRHGGEAQISGDGFITGPSHEGGGVVPEMEGGEFFYSDGRKMAVVKKEATREHFALLRAVNNNDRPTMRAYLQKMTGGVSRNVEATEVAASAARETMFTAQRPDAATLQLWKKNNQLVEENNRLTQKLLDAEKDRVQMFDMGDYYLRVERGKETRIKKGA